MFFSDFSLFDWAVAFTIYPKLPLTSCCMDYQFPYFFSRFCLAVSDIKIIFLSSSYTKIIKYLLHSSPSVSEKNGWNCELPDYISSPHKHHCISDIPLLHSTRGQESFYIIWHIWWLQVLFQIRNWKHGLLHVCTCMRNHSIKSSPYASNHFLSLLLLFSWKVLSPGG